MLILLKNDDKEQRIKYRSIHPIILMYHRQLLLCFTLRNSTFTMVANHCYVHNTFANILIIFEITNQSLLIFRLLKQEVLKEGYFATNKYFFRVKSHIMSICQCVKDSFLY